MNFWIRVWEHKEWELPTTDRSPGNCEASGQQEQQGSKAAAHRMGETLASYLSDRGLMSRPYKELENPKH